MKKSLLMLAIFLAPLTAAAQAANPAAGDCAAARDPDRCEARRMALQACADKHGAAKRACLDAQMPPVDCSKAADPKRCESVEQAKQVCQGKTGKALKQCLKQEKPKARKGKQKRPKNTPSR